MKKAILIVMLMFWAVTLFAQTQPTQLQQAQAEINKLNILLEGKFEEVRTLIIQNEEMVQYIKSQSNGIVAATNVLQKGYDDDGKIDFKALVKLGFKLNLPPDKSDKGKKSDKKDKL